MKLLKSVLFISTISLFFLMASIFPSCTSVNEEDLFPIDTTAAISYMDDLVPTLEQNCYTCHDLANHAQIGAGVQLDTYATLITYVNSGQLLGAIKHEAPYTPMPLGGGTKLSDAFIANLEAWIDRGANDN